MARDLPSDIINQFARRLNCIENFVSVGAVCKSWQSAVAEIKKNTNSQMRFSPLLILSPPNGDNEEVWQRVLSLDSKRVVRTEWGHLTGGKRCWGTPFGWILTYDLDLNIHLFNPLSHLQLSLPPRSAFPKIDDNYNDSDPDPESDYVHPEPEYLRRDFLQKLFLSSNPSISLSSLQILAFFGSCAWLAYIKFGDENWTYIQSEGGHTDAIFFKGQFYVVDNRGCLLLCETIAPKVTQFASPPADLGSDVPDTDKFYLIEISGEIHMVLRFFKVFNGNYQWEAHYKAYDFTVYKFDFHSKTWTELEDLGAIAIFLGQSNSFVVSIADSPELKCNSIYFTDDYFDLMGNSFCDMGVYDYADRTIEPLYEGHDVLTKFTRPCFFIPNY